MFNGTQEFQKMANEANKMMLESWSSWTKQTIQSENFASGAGAFMDWSLATHKMMTELSGQMMESMDIPRRSDLARISAQVQAVETRMLEQEDAQDDIKDLLHNIASKLDKIEKAQQVKPAAAPAPAPKVVAKAAPAPAPKVVAKAAAAPEVKTEAKPAPKAKTTKRASTKKPATKTAAKAKKATTRAKKAKAKKVSKSK